MCFLGYHIGTKGYKLLVIQKGGYKIITSRSVTFNESVFYFKEKTNSTIERQDMILLLILLEAGQEIMKINREEFKPAQLRLLLRTKASMLVWMIYLTNQGFFRMAEGGTWAAAAAAMERWRALEFYSGIGGLRYSLERSRVSATVVEAFDINNIANDVYQHNFGHRPFQGNIQTLTAADLDRYEAQVWLLSPPCQPYTRQGLQKGSADARASSFLTILELIPSMLKPPVLLFVENVVGFETSDTHSMMIDLLEKCEFVTQEFILSPLQFGVPYSRPRYYCLAKRKSSSFKNPQFNNMLLSTADLLVGDNCTKSGATFEGKASSDNEKFLQHCDPVEKFLEFKHFDELAEDSLSSVYIVPQSLVERWGSAMDIVYPNSKRCCCFTKSYYRYVKGTGSFIATGDLADDSDKVSALKSRCLRYFTPREVASLHSFPANFHFPSEITLKQRYALLGNSLSVAVVSSLLKYLFEDP